MLRRCVHVVMTLVFLLSDRSVTSQRHCEAPGSPRAISFTISSRRNQAGEWSSHVRCRRETDSNDVDCEELAGWIIDLRQFTKPSEGGETFDVVASFTAPPAKAEPGYEQVPDLGYYKLHTTPTTWPQARDTCNEERAYLAVVNSEKELQALQGIFALHPNITPGWQNYLAFLGFHDLFQEGQYVTVFGDPLDSTGFSQFNSAENEPTDKDGSKNENCGAIPREGQLHDVSCDDKLPFFCEQF